ncbi:hypothetical protein KR032_008406 [Drosophila birchii]|nr:hypothetical protein KR032_008406 [Drosophila birchii]
MQSKMVSSWFHLFLLGSLCFGIFSAPLDPSNEDQDPELTPGYFEGDIILDTDRSGLLKPARLWPNGIVPYNISDQFEQPFVDGILQAMRGIEEVTCVRFVPAVNETAYLSIIVSLEGCSAQVGFVANSVRIVNLKPVQENKGCFILAVTQHELLHSLGLQHQHKSPDRDSYVKIVKKNIKEGMESAFEKTSAANFGNYGENYDYGSVMHYKPNGFSKNGLPTIVALDPVAGAVMGQRIKMSDVDIRRLNKMYNCTT